MEKPLINNIDYNLFVKYINWDEISASEKLSINFIIIYQVLSESFIEKYSDKLDWYTIGVNQKLSENFIRELSQLI